MRERIIGRAHAVEQTDLTSASTSRHAKLPHTCGTSEFAYTGAGRELLRADCGDHLNVLEKVPVTCTWLVLPSGWLSLLTTLDGNNPA